MRLSSQIIATFLATSQFATIHGFSFVGGSSSRNSGAVLRAESVEAEVTTAGPRKKPLSPAELLAKIRRDKGLPEEEEEAPKLFDESLYDDMQNILLALEKRVADGPGSLSLLEVEDFAAMSTRVVKEMKEKEADRVAGRLDNLASAAPPQPAAVAAAPAEPAAAIAPPQAEVVAAEPAAPEVETVETVQDISQDEGPMYDGTGGMGLAKGTTNTYVIPGMDEMSPDEYQAALQKSISDRQAQRKVGGNYGNRQTWDYLNNLSGEKGQLRD